MNLFKYDLKIYNKIDSSFISFIVSSKKWYIIELNLNRIYFIALLLVYFVYKKLIFFSIIYNIIVYYCTIYYLFIYHIIIYYLFISQSELSEKISLEETEIRK